MGTIPMFPISRHLIGDRRHTLSTTRTPGFPLLFYQFHAAVLRAAQRPHAPASLLDILALRNKPPRFFGFIRGSQPSLFSVPSPHDRHPPRARDSPIASCLGLLLSSRASGLEARLLRPDSAVGNPDTFAKDADTACHPAAGREEHRDDGSQPVSQPAVAAGQARH